MRRFFITDLILR